MLANRTAPVSGRFQAFVQAKGNAIQLPNFMAVVAGVKPSMDDWVRQDRVDQYLAMVREFGVQVWEDVYFDPIEHDQELQGVMGRHLLNTTKARGFERPPSTPGSLLHVFLSRDSKHLQGAYESGWYPLIIGNRVMNLPLSDHILLGQALGYPGCCVEFFRQHNDWETQNTYYSAYVNSNRRRLAICNCLPKHTPFYYTYHMPCSFGCEATARRATELRAFIASEDAGYVRLIDRVVNLPVLIFTEDCAYLIVGEMLNEHECTYTGVFFLGNPGRDRYTKNLERGNRIRINENAVLVSRGAKCVEVIETRADKSAPEIPLIVSWNG
jgi:hypothetical protein